MIASERLPSWFYDNSIDKKKTANNSAFTVWMAREMNIFGPSFICLFMLFLHPLNTQLAHYFIYWNFFLSHSNGEITQSFISRTKIEWQPMRFNRCSKADFMAEKHTKWLIVWPNNVRIAKIASIFTNKTIFELKKRHAICSFQRIWACSTCEQQTHIWYLRFFYSRIFIV